MKDLEIPISRIGYGCYSLSGAYGENISEQEKISIIHAAYDLGIRFFDTAGSYDGTEEVLGKAVQPFRNKISIATKVSLDENNQANLSKMAVVESCMKSLRKLNTDYIDLFQVHYDDPNTPVYDTVEALEFLKGDGYIRHFGIGHLPISRSLEYLRYGNCSTVMAEMNPVSLNRYLELSPYINQYRFGIIAFSVTARGLLTGKINEGTEFHKDDLRSIDPLFKRAKLKSGLRVAKKLSEAGEKYSKSSSQMAIAWILQKKGVLTALTGPSKLNHLKENLEVLNWKIPDEEFSNLNNLFQKETKDLNRIIMREIEEILTFPLNEDPKLATNDLIYVLENLIEGDFLSTENGYPLFLELLKSSKGDKNIKKLEKIKEKIKFESSFDQDRV